MQRNLDTPRLDEPNDATNALVTLASGPHGGRPLSVNLFDIHLVEGVGLTDDALRDVANMHAPRGDPPLRPTMGMTVDHQIGPRAVDRFGEQIAARRSSPSGDPWWRLSGLLTPLRVPR
jgi:hypothetical protein